MTRVEPSDRAVCGHPIGQFGRCDLPKGHLPIMPGMGWTHQQSLEPRENPVTPIETMDPAAFTTVAIDFDGVIHAYSKGWHDGTCYDPPVPGALEAIDQLMGTRPVAIMSARPIEPIGDWLDKHAAHIPYVLDQNLFFDHWADNTTVLVTNRKIVAAHYIDDRALRFDRTGWTSMLGQVVAWDDAYAARRAERDLCTACGNPKSDGTHGMSEYGGCV